MATPSTIRCPVIPIILALNLRVQYELPLGAAARKLGLYWELYNATNRNNFGNPDNERNSAAVQYAHHRRRAPHDAARTSLLVLESVLHLASVVHGQQLTVDRSLTSTPALCQL